MKALLICVAILLVLSSSCTRRPVQKDVVLDHNSNHSADHSNMQSSPGAAEAPYELQFIDTMIVHHQGAIDAGQLAPTRCQHDELKQLARSIVNDQQTEISQLRAWRSEWFGEKPAAVNMELPGMRDGMREMDLEKLDRLKENPFDLEFIRQMIPHHEGAVLMASDLLKQKNTHAELVKLADSIVSSQSGEIEQMRLWQAEWRKE